MLPPVARFSFQADYFNIQFTDRSIANQSPITSWVWDFGDGNSSNQQNPAHYYHLPGDYIVSLTVSNAFGTNTISKGIRIVAPTPKADFNTTNLDNLKFQFNDLSIGNGEEITDWEWDFGNNSKSKEQNPQYIYLREGTYIVSLTVTNYWGNSHKVSKAVAVKPLPKKALVDFDYYVEAGKVQFVNKSQDNGYNITSYTWFFGDGVTSTEISPGHSYLIPGTYIVSLIATNLGGDSIFSKEILVPITNPEAPKAYFSYTQDGYSFSFNDLSLENGSEIISRVWSFGEPVISLEKNPKHSYDFGGEYIVTLEVKNRYGSSKFSQKVNAGPRPGSEIDIIDLIKCKINERDYDEDCTRRAIKKWQMYLYIFPYNRIPESRIFDQDYWPPIFNVLIAELVIYELIIAAANKFMLGGGISQTVNQIQNSFGSGNGDDATVIQPINTPAALEGIKAIETGPSRVEFYNLSAIIEGLQKYQNEYAKTVYSYGDGMMESYRRHICMLASRLRVPLAICDKLAEPTILFSGAFNKKRPSMSKLLVGVAPYDWPQRRKESNSYTSETYEEFTMPLEPTFNAIVYPESVQLRERRPETFTFFVALNRVNLVGPIEGIYSFKNTNIDGIAVTGVTSITGDHVILQLTYSGTARNGQSGYIDIQFIHRDSNIHRNLKIPISVAPPTVVDTEIRAVPLGELQTYRNSTKRRVVLVNRLGDCNSVVYVTPGPLPSGVTINPITIDAGESYADLDIITDNLVDFGQYQITLNYSGCGESATSTFTLIVMPDNYQTPSFNVSKIQPITIIRGREHAALLSVYRYNGCISHITVVPQNLPDNISISPMVIASNSGYLRVSTNDNILPGIYNILLAFSGCGQSKEEYLQVVVVGNELECSGAEDFTLNSELSNLSEVSFVIGKSKELTRHVTITKGDNCFGTLELKVDETLSQLPFGFSVPNLPSNSIGAFKEIEIVYDGSTTDDDNNPIEPGDYRLVILLEACNSCITYPYEIPIKLSEPPPVED